MTSLTAGRHGAYAPFGVTNPRQLEAGMEGGEERKKGHAKRGRRAAPAAQGAIPSSVAEGAFRQLEVGVLSAFSGENARCLSQPAGEESVGAVQEKFFPAQSAETVDKIARATEISRSFPQEKLKLEHAFWAGLYARTLTLPKGVMITGVTIRIPTLLILSGDVLAMGDRGFERFTGYHVLKGREGRRALFVAVEDTKMTMLFATNAESVEQAEQEFTDTPEALAKGI